MAFWVDDFPFPKAGYVNSLEGNTLGTVHLIPIGIEFWSRVTRHQNNRIVAKRAQPHGFVWARLGKICTALQAREQVWLSTDIDFPFKILWYPFVTVHLHSHYSTMHCQGGETKSEQQPPKDHKSLLPSQAIQLDIKISTFSNRLQDGFLILFRLRGSVFPMAFLLTVPSICLSGLNTWGVMLCCLEIIFPSSNTCFVKGAEF